jgi:hypothetical protein
MRRTVLALPIVLFAPASQAIQDQAPLCDQAAHRAARMTGVPLDILMAVTRIETGRDIGNGLAPWPWTINVGGEGSFYDEAAAARDQALVLLDSGTQSFDVGCFQLNYRWHGGAFASMESMFDPEENALYAANFLLSLYQSSGNWTQATGAYHSQTDDLAAGYIDRVNALLGGGLTPEFAEGSGEGGLRILRENNFPLLKTGAKGLGASIVPRTESLGSLFAAAD